MNEKLFDFICASPTAYHTVSTVCSMLDGEGFINLEKCDSPIKAGNGYYTTRNGSSVIAFRVPECFDGLMITASHGDTPQFKVKKEISGSHGYIKLDTERYGGMIPSTWFDRPLSIAGRVITDEGGRIESHLIDLGSPVAIIPNVAPHFNFTNPENPAVDLIPTASLAKPLNELIADAVGGKRVVGHDLFLYHCQRGIQLNDYILSPKLDDLMCAFACLKGFIDARDPKNLSMLCIFDNEEVGSSTKQGADSTFLTYVLDRIARDCGKSVDALLASSMLLSCDNAHAVHPNHPELSDKEHAPRLNGGIVIKHNANQKYTTDGISEALLRHVLDANSIPYQHFYNRADLRGGSTLGNILNTQVSLNTADIGLAQLAMHSSMESAGARDTEYMIALTKAFYETAITCLNDGTYSIEP